jgi:competence protein ComEA
MKAAWQLTFGLAAGLLAAGLIFLVTRSPVGTPVTLLPPPTPAPLVIYVTGAVQSPGVYEFAPGSRVRDAIDSAGGFSPSAEPETLNLAAPLEDGMRLDVPEVKPTLSSGMAQRNPGNLENELININTANQAELEELPNIGSVIAQRIIAYRETFGPYQSINDLLAVEGIGEKTLAEIQDLITTGAE